jgi:hypothetical protein
MLWIWYGSNYCGSLCFFCGANEKHNLDSLAAKITLLQRATFIIEWQKESCKEMLADTMQKLFSHVNILGTQINIWCC